jgi:hypothetical protein
MTPQEPKGEQAQADAAVAVAIRILEHSLVAHGASSPKGKAIMHALGGLTKAFGQDEDKAREVMPAELQTALMAPGGGGAEQEPQPGAAGGAGAMQ